MKPLSPKNCFIVYRRKAWRAAIYKPAVKRKMDCKKEIQRQICSVWSSLLWRMRTALSQTGLVKVWGKAGGLEMWQSAEKWEKRGKYSPTLKEKHCILPLWLPLIVCWQRIMRSGRHVSGKCPAGHWKLWGLEKEAEITNRWKTIRKADGAYGNRDERWRKDFEQQAIRQDHEETERTAKPERRPQKKTDWRKVVSKEQKIWTVWEK